MPKKALVVKFRNASVFTDPRRSSDRVYYGKTVQDRASAPRISTPPDTVDARHVSNLLHVLMGERPVPSLRPSDMQRDETIYAAAKAAMVKVEEVSVDETKTIRKAFKGSWNTARIWYHLGGKDVKVKGGVLYHDRLARFLGPDLYGNFLAVLGELTGSPNPRADMSVQEGVEFLNQHSQDLRVKQFTAHCRADKRTALANLIEPGGNTESISFHQGTGSRLNILVVNKGIEKIRRVSGTLVIPIETAELQQRLERGSGVATFLEGGFAYIAGVDDWSDTLIQDCKQVVEGEIIHVANQSA